MLADVWCDFNKRIYEDFGLYPGNFCTGPALTFIAGLKKSQTDIKMLDDFSMYEIFSNSIRGGFCCVNQRRVKCNNIDMGEKYDPNKPSSTFVMLDFNSLYAECLSQNLPYDGFKYLDDQIVTQYESDPKKFLEIDTSLASKKGYWVTVDYEIPNSLARLTDDMPLSLINTEKILLNSHTRCLGERS